MALSYFDTAWNAAGTVSGQSMYKDLTITGAAVGDLIVAFAVGEGYLNVSGTRDVTTQSGGATTSWTASSPAVTVNNDVDVVGSWAVVTTAGNIVIRGQVRQSVGRMGVAAFLIPAAEVGSTYGWSTTLVADADGQTSVTLSASSTVIYGAGDWAATNMGSTTVPSGGTNHRTYFDTSNYSAWFASWTSQASGTRNYGPSGLTGHDISGSVFRMDTASAGPTTVNGTDSATHTDGTAGILAATARTDTNTLADASSLTTSQGASGTDTAALSDSPGTFSATNSASDTATVSDSITNAATAAAADGAAVSDTSSVSQGNTQAANDSSTTAEAIVTSATIVGTDTANSNDTSQVVKPVPTTDAATVDEGDTAVLITDLAADGTLADSAAIVVTTSRSDASGFSEGPVVVVAGSSAKTANDSSTTAEATQLNANLATSDTAAQADSATLVNLGLPRRDLTITGVTEPTTAWQTTDLITGWASTDPNTTWGTTEPAGLWTHTEPAILQAWTTTAPASATSTTEPTLAYATTEPSL